MPRKLAAILSADVVSYSRMMEADEPGTLARLRTNRSAIFDPQVAANDGRIFKLIGDGALAEFPSVVSAVECALAIQAATAEAAEDVPESKRIRYRIGINLGDVVVEGDDIYGDGVNIAARIQALAEPGGVAVSSNVRDYMSGKGDIQFKDMGDHTVKNIERPVHVFAVVPRPPAPKKSARHSICVLPFANMSDDPQQEYFSDGISEDIITDLSKVSALGIIARNTAFQFKAKSVDIPVIARQLKVTHILEGSVRKAGTRLRITAQLIDGTSGEHVWAERYDRNLDDIFALQDEISEAIVKALKLKLLPAEKEAIERRGTNSVEAYNLYLLARQAYATGFEANVQNVEGIVRIVKRATEIDPGYAQAWALMALGQTLLRYTHNREGEDGLAAAERALALDAGLAEAHSVKARIFAENGRHNDASSEIEIALRLDPESFEVNKSAGRLNFGLHKLEDAARYWEKAVSLMESDFASMGMLITCYTALGNKTAALRAAQRTLTSAEKVLTQDRNNGSAMGHASVALTTLGEVERAKEMMGRAILLDPDNLNMRYNFVCSLATYSDDVEGALDMLEPLMARLTDGLIRYSKIDPDLDPLREHPRFKAMLAAAEARVAADAKAN